MFRNVSTKVAGTGRPISRMLSAMPKPKIAKAGKDLVLVDGVRTP